MSRVRGSGEKVKRLAWCGLWWSCLAGDNDNDGDADLYLTNLGEDTLYRNDGGNAGNWLQIH